jgi:hypothetical protein
VLWGLRHLLTYPEYRVILAELGDRPTQRKTARELDAEYVFTRSDAEFSPGRAMNVGFLHRPHPQPLVYFHQADFAVRADVLDESAGLQESLGCPFVYPYWGEIHLSRLVSDAVRANPACQSALLRRIAPSIVRWRAEPSIATAPPVEYDEVLPQAMDIEAIRDVLPDLSWSAIADAPADVLWGVDDRHYAPYRWKPSDSFSSRIWRISGGPRASAGYLCTDAAFRSVGGIPELPGWGYEDLLFWLTVQAFYPYSDDRRSIYFNSNPITLDIPFVHLWHPVGGRANYYAATRSNESLYHSFRALNHQQRRATVTSLHSRGTEQYGTAISEPPDTIEGTI